MKSTSLNELVALWGFLSLNKAMLTKMDPTMWQPNSPISYLFKRANIIRDIRHFFDQRHILEVETPILSHAAVTDVYLESFHTYLNASGDTFQRHHSKRLSLITSPEYHMKRLLAAGSGPIFQITKCFRNEEIGRYHNPEFSMLEWYRPGFSMMALIEEADDLLKIILKTQPTERMSYQDAYLRYLNVDPLTADRTTLYQLATSLNLGFNHQEADHDLLLQILFTFGIEPHIGKSKPTVIYHFPASQAALATLCCDDHRTANRFEIYYKGVELANGFEELTCAKEQRARFEKDNASRKLKKLEPQPIDELFLSALQAGMPASSGIALGLDRLIMLAIKANRVSDVLSFNVERA